jgi:hypothetical protein
MANDFIAGAWRNGVSDSTLSFVNEEMERRRAGFRLLPLSSTVVELADLLDSSDALFEELLTADTPITIEPTPQKARAKK